MKSMKKDVYDKKSFDNYVGCFGYFQIQDRVCKHLCVLRLRCSIEHERNNRLALMEDLISVDNTFFRIQ